MSNAHAHATEVFSAQVKIFDCYDYSGYSGIGPTSVRWRT
jgi:hypothetical protein